MGVNPSLGAGLGLVFSVLVLAYCAKKFHKSKKLVPGGVLFGFSAWTLLAYLRFFLKF